MDPVPDVVTIVNPSFLPTGVLDEDGDMLHDFAPGCILLLADGSRLIRQQDGTWMRAPAPAPDT